MPITTTEFRAVNTELCKVQKMSEITTYRKLNNRYADTFESESLTALHSGIFRSGIDPESEEGDIAQESSIFRYLREQWQICDRALRQTQRLYVESHNQERVATRKMQRTLLSLLFNEDVGEMVGGFL